MQVLGWLVAVVPIVVGLATIDASLVDRTPQVLQADASAQGEAGAATELGRSASKPISSALESEAFAP